MRLSAISETKLQAYPSLLLGFGRSGPAVTDFLLSLGRAPTVYDGGGIPPEVLAHYTAHGVRFAGAIPQTLSASFLFRSPVIRPDIEAIRVALSHGAVLTGEVDLFHTLTAATVIGVTGSDGKTTTAAMIAALLRAAGHRVLLGGNNGIPLLPKLHLLGKGDFAVVELSSFQLMTAPAPHVAVLTNLSENHLNWHRDMTEYVLAKCRILQGAERLVTNADCALTRGIAAHAPLPKALFGTECGAVGDAAISATVAGVFLILSENGTRRALPVFQSFALPGRHNRENFAAAVLAARPFVSDGDVLRVASEFRGVPHRLQTIGCVGGITFINSSIDTSPSRTVAALSALSSAPVVIAGGRGKGVPLSPLGRALSERAKAAVLYGEAANEIARTLSPHLPYTVTESFSAAFYAAVHYARAGDTVLLSPGCTAFGEFRDFEERGECFCRLVKAFAEERNENIGTSRADPRDGGTHEHHGL